MTKIKKPYVEFIGNASSEVTGSAYVVRFSDKKILLEFGLIQDERDIFTLYNANKEMVKAVKAQTLDYVIVPHGNHIDHTGLCPALYRNGYKGKLYIPKGNKKFLKILWEDSLKVMKSDCAKIQKKNGKPVSVFYEQEDIEKALNSIVEVDFNETVNLNDEISFYFIPSGHVVNSASLMLNLESKGITKRIYYSSDIGGEIPQRYVQQRETPRQFDLGIVESTYSEPSRMTNPKDRPKDLEKIVSVVNEYKCVMIPCFAFSRGQAILSELYLLWQRGLIPKDIAIYYDSPLGQKISEIYTDDPFWKEVYQWENIVKIETYKESLAAQQSNRKCVVIASAGMMKSGRILGWLKAKLCDKTAHILFCGYTPKEEDSLASQIKSNKPWVQIDGEWVENFANYTELRSFSSHANYYELLDFYSLLKTNKLCLVHGDMTNKIAFSDVLQEKFVEQGLSTRVSAVQISDKIYF